MLAIAVVLLLFALLGYIRQWNRFYYYAGFGALVGHIVVAYFVLPVVPYGWDIGNFHNAALAFLEGESPDASTSVTSFGAFQAVVYALFGVDTLNVSVVNSLLAVLVPIPAVYLARKLYGEQLESTHGVVALILFLPLPFLFLTIPMRESLTVFTVFCALALGVSVLTERKLWALVPLLPLLTGIYYLRTEWALVLILGLLAGAAILVYEALDIELSLSSILVTLGALGGLGFVLFAELMYSFDRANAELSWRASGGAVYLEGMEYTSWLDFLIAAPARALYFQFAPFPLHIESLFHALAFVSTLYIIVFVIAAVRSLVASETDTVVLGTLLVVYLAGITGYGLINSNFGTNVRHRIPFVFMLVVFAAPVVQRWELTIRERLGVRPNEDTHESRNEYETQEGHDDVLAQEKHASETHE